MYASTTSSLLAFIVEAVFVLPTVAVSHDVFFSSLPFCRKLSYYYWVVALLCKGLAGVWVCVRRTAATEKEVEEEEEEEEEGRVKERVVAVAAGVRRVG